VCHCCQWVVWSSHIVRYAHLVRRLSGHIFVMSAELSKSRDTRYAPSRITEQYPALTSPAHPLLSVADKREQILAGSTIPRMSRKGLCPLEISKGLAVHGCETVATARLPVVRVIFRTHLHKCQFSPAQPRYARMWNLLVACSWSGQVGLPRRCEQPGCFPWENTGGRVERTPKVGHRNHVSNLQRSPLV
jgi:hypothetical protein